MPNSHNNNPTTNDHKNVTTRTTGRIISRIIGEPESRLTELYEAQTKCPVISSWAGGPESMEALKTDHMILSYVILYYVRLH